MSEPDPSRQRAVGEFWSKRTRASANWWTNRMVVREINRRIGGRPQAEVGRGLIDLGLAVCSGEARRHGVSVGCGNGIKEIALVKSGFVERMTAYDLAPARISQAQAAAELAGLADRITFHCADGFARHQHAEFDLVYWNNALHHMFDVPGALAWSREVLVPGGVLLLEEYVGPSRMAFAPATMAFANAIRAVLPDRLLVGADGVIDRDLTPPWFQARIARDPSETVDAGRTLPALRGLFDAPQIRPLGGVVYFIALNGLFGNFDMATPDDRRILEGLLKLDEGFTLGHPNETIYAAAAARR